VKDLGHHTKKGASFIIMSIVGGALMPYVMGVLSEKYSTAVSYSVPLACFLIVAWYGWKGYIVKGGSNSAVKVEFKH
jgi:FHS family L-fucose permease-like MFS transporter